MGEYKTFDMALSEDPVRARMRMEFGIAMHNTAKQLLDNGVDPLDILSAYIGAMRMLVCCVESEQNRTAIIDWIVDNLRDGQVEAMADQRLAATKSEGSA